MNTLELSKIFGMEPEAAVRFLESKGYAITWDWHEMLDEARARAFTVAKVTRIDMLQDIRAALGKSLKDGLTLRDFQKSLTPLLQAKGWWGKQIIVDSAGNAEVVQLGSPRRLKTIYQTNLQSAYMAGRYQAMKASADSHPYWQYVSVLDGKTRPSHRAMNGRIFRHDDGLWNTSFPPNGFNCRCRARPMSEFSVAREGRAPESSQGRLMQIEKEAGTDKRTGEVRKTTVTGMRVIDASGKPVIFAPDAGFNFNAGQSWAKPFTPPPLSGLPRTFMPGQVLPGLPAAERFPASRVLPAGLAEEEYARRFVREFDGKLTGGAFIDAMGEALPVNEDLFRDGKGAWKIAKEGRERYLPLLAETLKKPDEIWLRWEASRAKPGEWLLKRRYLKNIDIGEDLHGVGVFELGADGWQGSTVFQSSQVKPEDRRAYLERQRDGFLLYRRKE